MTATNSMSARPAAGVLVVCTGNVCRSPMAEMLFRAGLAARFGDRHTEISVTSAGTCVRPGSTLDERTADWLCDVGIDKRPFVPRQLDSQMITEAELVLTLTREHRRAVLGLTPKAVRYTFTLRELARLLGVIPMKKQSRTGLVERLREIRDVAWENRGAIRSTPPEDEDITDPSPSDPAAFTRIARSIDSAVNACLNALTGPSPVPQWGPDGIRGC